MADFDVIVIGAGLAGLTCALRLQEQGLSVKVYERADHVGGRVWTDREDGYLFDRGFQVLLTAYPECREWLDYETLGLQAFSPGSLIRWRGKMHEIGDPWREPGLFLKMAFGPIGNFRDKLLIRKYRNILKQTRLRDLYFRENRPSIEYLEEMGFSNRIIDQFFRPFFSGVFQESELETSSRVLDFVFKMFSEGDAALPEKGMAAVPEALYARLSPEVVELETEVFEVEPGRVELAHGHRVTADSVAIAVPFSLIGTLVKGMVFPTRGWHGTTSVYYAAETSPLLAPKIFLNAEPESLVCNVSVPSDIQSAYTSDGTSLVCVTVLGAPDFEEIRKPLERELAGLFPDDFPQWEYLRHYRVERALPRQNVIDIEPVERIEALEPGFYMCGDHRQTSSIQGAMASGRRAAEALIKERRLTAD